MDVAKHRSPFVFAHNELPVVMMFPAVNKKPIEFGPQEFSNVALQRFALDHAAAAGAFLDVEVPDRTRTEL